MAVHPHRAAWTDERLDDLNQTIRDGFARNDREHLAFRAEMKEGFERGDRKHEQLRAEMNRRFDAMDQKFDDKFDSLQRVLVIGLFGIVATLIGAIVALA